MFNVIDAIEEKLQAYKDEIRSKNWQIEALTAELGALKVQLEKAQNEIAVLSVAKQ